MQIKNTWSYFQVSFVDSWFLSLNPIKRLLLRIMKKSKPDGKSALHRQIVYSFGDHYYFRKELKILNLLTGYRNLSLFPHFYPGLPDKVVTHLTFTHHRYIFLVDKFGRIRWQGFGLAAEEELASLLSCTTLLLEEKWDGLSKLPWIFTKSQMPHSRQFCRAAFVIMAVFRFISCYLWPDYFGLLVPLILVLLFVFLVYLIADHFANCGE